MAERPTFTWLGHATVRCDLPGGEVVLIDALVDGNPVCPAAAKELPRLDALLLTHGHDDHIGDAVALAAAHRPRAVVAAHEVCLWLRGQGVSNLAPMSVGGSQRVLDLTVTMVRADHGTAIDVGGKLVPGGVAAGYVVRTADGFAFYHAGDTALFSDMHLIGELYRPRLAFLPIGDLYTMGPREAAWACRFLGVRQVVPIHWGTSPALTGKPAALVAELRSLGVDCEVVELAPGASW